jgi:diguanylate cyclase with GGDEF domain
MSFIISTLLTRNLHGVCGENDPARRRAAIDEIFTEDCVFYDPSNGVYRGRDEIDRVAGAIKATLPTFAINTLPHRLPNRVSLHDDLIDAIGSNGGPAEGICIAMFDLDGFKDVNLLQDVARMEQIAAGIGRVYRFGGDEFVLLRHGSEDPLEFARVVENVLKRLADRFEISGHRLLIGASAGIATAPASVPTSRS